MNREHIRHPSRGLPLLPGMRPFPFTVLGTTNMSKRHSGVQTNVIMSNKALSLTVHLSSIIVFNSSSTSTQNAIEEKEVSKTDRRKKTEEHTKLITLRFHLPHITIIFFSRSDSRKLISIYISKPSPAQLTDHDYKTGRCK